MAYYPDLGTESGIDDGPEVRAIGWLNPGRPYPVAKADPEFLACLERHAAAAHRFAISMGMHACELCTHPVPRDFRFSRHARLGCSGLWIPARHALYVAPEILPHYVDDHEYAPPEEFVTAVLACPPQGSLEFFTLLRGLPQWWQVHYGNRTVEQAMLV